MSTRGEQVFEDALSLPVNERAELAERLLSSLDLHSQQENEKLWAQEVESRIDAFERGEIKTISADDVFNKINAQKKS